MSNSPAFSLGSGGGTPGNPCASYQAVQCGSPSNTASDYASYFRDPRTLRDANGCFMFNGCYLSFGGQYFYWNGQASGYVIAYPQSPGATQYAPGAGLPQPQQTTNPAPSTKPSVYFDPGSGLYKDAATGKTYNYGGDPARISDFFNVVSGPGAQSTDLSTILAGFQGFQQGLATVNQGLAGIPQTLGQALVAGNGPLVQAIRDLIVKVTGQPQGAIPDITELSQALTNAVNKAFETSDERSKQQADAFNAFVGDISNQFAQLATGLTDKFAQAEAETAEANKPLVDKGSQTLDQLHDLLASINRVSRGDLGPLFSGVFGQIAGQLPEEIGKRLEGYKLLFDYMLAGKFNSWSELEAALLALGGRNDFGFLLIDLFAVATIVLRLGIIRANPIADELNQLSMADHPVRPLDQNTLLEAFRRKEIDATELAQNMAKLGLDSDKTALAARLTENLPQTGILEQGYLRGFVDQAYVIDQLQKQGYGLEAINTIWNLFNHIPAPADLTRIADKRVWSTHTAPKYGQYEELPDQYRDYMAQWGFDPKFTEWLWASHWNLPSPQQVFEMFHRSVIDRDDMETYLGLTDWLPFFRDKLLDISYNPLGRIDIKRAHNSGIIDDATALQKYKDIGYEESNARILLEISKQASHDNAEHILQSLTDKARNAVERAYVKGTIDAQTAYQHLVDLGLDTATAGAILALLNHEIATQGALNHREIHQKRAIEAVIHAFSRGSLPYDEAVAYLGDLSVDRDSAIHELMFAEIERVAQLKGEWATHAVKLFAEHTIEYPDFVNMLTQQGFSQVEITQLGQEADMKRQQRTKKPTEAQFKSMYKKQIISEAEFANELRGLGYVEKYVAMLVAEA